MRKAFATVIVAASALLIFSSCREIFARRIQGNGNIATQTRYAHQFDGINVSGDIDVYVKQDSATSIRVEADENLQQYIETINDDHVLYIRPEMGYHLWSTKQIKVYVSSPLFKEFEASGACQVFSDGKITSSSAIDIDLSGSCGAMLDLNAPKISAGASGACTIQLKGQTKEFNLQGSGSTTVRCFDLLSENVDVDISGAGNAEVYASAKLSGSISGAADVHYKGNAQTDIQTSGASSVMKANQ